MIGLQSESRSRALQLAFAAGALLLSASLANFLVHNDYPLLRPEVFIVWTGLLLVSAVMAWLYVGQRQWGRSFLEGFLVLLFADFNGVPILPTVLAALAVGLFTWWFRFSLTGPFAIFGAVILTTTLAGVGGRPTWIRTESTAVARSNRVPAPSFAILHILLDEQAGVHGIYPDANGLRLRREIRDFFSARGFALYGRAYSEHMHTVNAIPAVLNFGTRLADNATDRGVRVGSTAYFKLLDERGFRIHVVQSDFAELCARNPVTVCTTYMTSSLGPTLQAPLATLERAQLIALKFVSLSYVLGRAFRAVNRAGALASRYGAGWPPFEPGNTSRTSTVGALEAIREWTPRLRNARPGEVHFAHLLLPHYPHVVAADCSYLPWGKWELRRSNTPVEQRRHTYAEQDRCTLRKLDELISAFDRSEGGRNGVIIVHGDHGSRLQKVPPVTDRLGQFSGDDVVAAHATLFAVRAPRSGARYYQTSQPITALLRNFVASNFQVPPDPTSTPVRTYILSDRHWRPQRRAAMPPNW